jgi:hypothetical protein
MNLKKTVSLGVSIFLLFVIVACGEQSFKKADIRLLNSKKSNESELIIETNSSDSKEVVLNPTIANMDRNSSTTETNESIALVVKESAKSDKIQLAELEAKLKAETLAMQSKHNISLKKLEADKAKLLKEKEVALAKLESEKEIAKTKELNRKELSLLELESQEKMVIAKLESQKSLSKEQKELDKIKSLNDKEVALAKIQTQKDISKNEEKIALSRAVSDKEIAIARLQNERELADKNIAFYKMIAMMVVGLIVLLLLIVYFINSRKRKNELKIHEDELRHKEYMEASRQHNEHIGKMLDVITDANADKGVKKEIVRLLKDQGKKGTLIEYKR